MSTTAEIWDGLERLWAHVPPLRPTRRQRLCRHMPGALRSLGRVRGTDEGEPWRNLPKRSTCRLCGMVLPR